MRRDVASDAGAHGDVQPAGLFLEGEERRPQFVSAAALKEVFESAGRSVRLVVLNACYTEAVASELLAHVDCIVGMRGALLDDVALKFAVGFYGGLAGGYSVAEAWKQGRAAIKLEQLPDDERPQLKVRAGVDAGQIVLAGEPGPDRTVTARPPVSSIARIATRPAGPPSWLSRTAEVLIDLLSGGRRRRLRRAIAGFERSMAAGATPEVARRYGDLVRLAVRTDVGAAVRVVSRHDGNIPDALYGLAFPDCESWLRAVAQTGDAVQQVVFAIASRVQLRELQYAAAERIALVCARSVDRDVLLWHLEHCRSLDILDRRLLEASLRVLCQRHSLADAPHWVRFLAAQADEDLPDLFAVRLALGHAQCVGAASPQSEAEIQVVHARAAAVLERLRDTTRELDALQARIARWITTLGRLSQAVRDPMRRFVACHAAGNHPQAVIAFEELRRSSGDRQPRTLWEAALSCLAAMDDRARYRAWLNDCSDVIAVEPPSTDRSDSFCRRVGPCLALIDTPTGSASGFLISDCLVATVHPTISKARDVVVTLAGAELPAVGVFTDERYGSELALVHLSHAVEVPPLRLGFSQFVEVGEPVTVITAPSSGQQSALGNRSVARGIVNRFWGPDRRSRMFEFSVRAPPDMRGGPVFNEMGEVIGVISGSPVASPMDGAAMSSSFSQAINAAVLRDMVVANSLAGGTTRNA